VDTRSEQFADRIASEFGLIPYIGVEHEFYVTGPGEQALVSRYRTVVRDAVQVVEERGAGQYELIFAPSSDMSAIAAAHAWATAALKTAAASTGAGLSFASRPFPDRLGSALQVSVSLRDETGAPVFYRAPGAGGLPVELLRTVNGLLVTARSLMHFFAPTSNCYERYQCRSYEDSLFTPCTLSWGCDNRSAAIRIPRAGVEPGTARVEHRLAGAAAPLAEVIAAVLHGIQTGLAVGTVPAIPRLYGRAIDTLDETNALPGPLPGGEHR
jgi:glutamine synthetase